MTLQVLAPTSGRVVAMEEVSDPVFAQGLVGPGAALVPDGDGPQDVLSPVDGRIVKLHPHAFVILHGSGPGVLVHLGIDTVKLEGEGFTLLHEEGDEVAAGDPVISWDPDAVRARGLDPVVPVVVMDLTGLELRTVLDPGDEAHRGQPLLEIA